MNSLEQVQEAFWRAAYLPPIGAPSAAAAYFLARGPGLAPEQAMALYGEAARLRHLEDLSQDFPLLRQGLGESLFTATCEAYLLATQARRPPLGRLGAELWAYLERQGRPRAQVELAALEDMRTAVGVAQDVSPAPPTALADAGDRLEDCRFAFVSAFRHRRANCDMARLAATPAALHAADISTSPHQLVVWRRGFDILQGHVEGAGAAALRLAVAGATVRVVCGVFGESPSAPQQAAACLGAWFADGWVARVA